MLIASMNSSNSFLEFITVLVIFVIVVVVAYYVTRWLGQYQKTQSKGVNIEVIESTRISPSAYVEIIRVADKCMAVAVSKENVTLLGEISEDSLMVPADSESGALDFADIWNKVKSSMPKKDLDEHEENK